jgi:hypothetical protein
VLCLCVLNATKLTVYGGAGGEETGAGKKRNALRAPKLELLLLQFVEVFGEHGVPHVVFEPGHGNDVQGFAGGLDERGVSVGHAEAPRDSSGACGCGPRP